MKHLSLALFILGFLSPFYSKSQPWVKREGQNQNFFEIRKEFYSYWEEVERKDAREKKKIERLVKKGKLPFEAMNFKDEDRQPGFKVFKRWEYFMEPRVYPSGNFPEPGILYKELEKQKSMRNSSGTPANWTLLGPAATIPTNGGGAGRLNCIAFDPTNNNNIWVGSPGGGLWKSPDGGATWTPINDLLPNLGVSDIAIHPTDPNIIYIATGDGDGSDTYSYGVMKSTDGGLSWNPTGLSMLVSSTKTINRIVIDPVNPDNIWVAASNGLWKSTNAGATFTQNRFGIHKDVKFQPGNSRAMYVAVGGKVYRTSNGGSNWTLINNGFPSTGINRLAIGVTPADSNIVYALASKSSDNGFHGLYKSTDKGATWTTASTSPNLLGWEVNGSDSDGQGWYDLAIAVSPTNANVIFVGGVNIWKSTNGGSTWSISTHWYGGGGKPYVHADEHMISFLPGSGTTVFSCNDGGLFKTTTTGSAWSDISNGLQIMQFYGIGASKTNPNLVLGGAQDNGTNRYSSGLWRKVVGGDGMDCIIDHTDANVMFGSLYYGDIRKSTNGGTSFYNVTPAGSDNGAWVTPYIMDPTDHDIMYAGYNEIFKSTDNGENWTQVTTGLSSGSQYKCLAVAPSNNQVIFAGTVAKLFKSIDGGTTWTNTTSSLPLGLAALTYIAVKPSDAQTVWVTCSGYSSGNKVFKSIDGGATWTNITGTTLPNVPVNCVAIENNIEERIFIGTDLGVYYTDNTLSSDWVAYNTGLPNVIVNELEIHPTSGKLRAGTYGRGLWETDILIGTPKTVNPFSKGSISVYPNPARSEFSIQLPGITTERATVEIINTLGQVIRSFEVEKNAKEIKAKIEHEAPGVYFVRMNSAGVSISQKFVIE